MHEMFLAGALLDQVLGIAADNRLDRVERVAVAVGRAREVVLEAFSLAFTAVSAGTVADGAELDLTEVPIRCRCRRCGREFETAIDRYACPGCGGAAVDLIDGREVVLMSVTGRAAGEGSPRLPGTAEGKPCTEGGAGPAAEGER